MSRVAISYCRAFWFTQLNQFSATPKPTEVLQFWGAAIAQWIHLQLPSCRPRFESQAHHLHFYILQSNLCYICHVERMKINPCFFKKSFTILVPGHRRHLRRSFNRFSAQFQFHYLSQFKHSLSRTPLNRQLSFLFELISANQWCQHGAVTSAVVVNVGEIWGRRSGIVVASFF